jgi:hypothetical protein
MKNRNRIFAAVALAAVALAAVLIFLPSHAELGSGLPGDQT